MTEDHSPLDREIDDSVEQYRTEFDAIAHKVVGDRKTDEHASCVASGFDLGFRVGRDTAAPDMDKDALEKALVAPGYVRLLRDVNAAIALLAGDESNEPLRAKLVHSVNTSRKEQERFLRASVSEVFRIPRVITEGKELSASEALDAGIAAFHADSPAILAFVLAPDGESKSGCRCLSCKVEVAHRRLREQGGTVAKDIEKVYGSIAVALAKFSVWAQKEVSTTVAIKLDFAFGEQPHQLDDDAAKSAAQDFLGKFLGGGSK